MGTSVQTHANQAQTYRGDGLFTRRISVTNQILVMGMLLYRGLGDTNNEGMWPHVKL